MQETGRSLSLWGAIWRFALFAGLFVAALLLLNVGVMVGGLILGSVLRNGPLAAFVETVYHARLVSFGLTWLAAAGATLFMYRVVDRRPMRAGGFGLSGGGWRWFLWGAALGAGLQTLIALAGLVTGGYRFAYNWGAGGDLGLWMQYAVSMFLVGWYEEALFRGYPMQLIDAYGGRWAAFGLTALLFAVAHLGNPGAGWMAVVGLIVFGVVAAWSIKVTGSMWLAIGEHMAWNICEGIVYGFPNSGVPEPYSILRAADHGPAWLTGGNFGPEAGLISIGALVIGLLFVRRLAAKS